MKTEQDNTNEITVQTGKITRYMVRNSLFRLRDNRVEDPEMVSAIWEIIRPQLQHPENINNFTFAWDVVPGNPLSVIRRHEWEAIKAAKYPLQHKKQEPVEEEITMFTGQRGISK